MKLFDVGVHSSLTTHALVQESQSKKSFCEKLGVKVSPVFKTLINMQFFSKRTGVGLKDKCIQGRKS